MNQNEFPFHETAEDATNTAIIRSGKAFKEVALALWPEMKADSAYAKLKNSLRPDTREHLTADQHILIANLVEQFDFLYYACQGCHHDRPDPVEPADELTELLRDYDRSLRRLEALAPKIQERRAHLRGVA